MSRTQYDVGKIFRDHLDEFLSLHHVPDNVEKSLVMISQCRTKALGGHVEVCPRCGFRLVSYNSCRDRHCPKCQNVDREKWLDMRRQELLPQAKYFHVVFTIPDCLHRVAMSHQADFYGSMFRAAWDTLKQFFADKNLKGGMSSVLHTWGSNMFYHPHLHCIVPGGGVDMWGNWRPLRACSGRNGKFLFPVKALSKVFRAKFMERLTAALKETGESIPQDVRKKCFENPWNLYSKAPMQGVDKVLEYISRYAYKVAISNSRIKNYTADGKVTYDYKDYRDGGKHKDMTVKAVDFMHLFSLHILPFGFMRIRHYGLLSPSCRDELRAVQVKMGGEPVPKVRHKKTTQQIIEEKGWEIGICPICECEMEIVEYFDPERAPPSGKAIQLLIPGLF